MNSIHTALKQARAQLGSSNAEAQMEAEILLSQVLNTNRAYLFTHPEQTLTQEQWATYQNFIEQRSEGRPIAYITGIRDFWSLSLLVNEHTLIPRHETERLVELALEFIPNEPNTNILDLGTGSGAIALSLAKERPHWRIDACDCSRQALDLAKENARRHGLHNVHFYHSNWFTQLPIKQYHALLANPPYLAAQDPHLQLGDLRFEPENALVSSQNGLADLQYLIQKGYNRLVPDGLILLEHGYEQKLSVLTILERSGYKSARCWQDIHGQDRVSGGWRLSA